MEAAWKLPLSCTFAPPFILRHFHISSDQAAFIAQKDTAGGKKTMRAYLWMVCGAAYDAEHSNG